MQQQQQLRKLCTLCNDIESVAAALHFCLAAATCELHMYTVGRGPQAAYCSLQFSVRRKHICNILQTTQHLETGYTAVDPPLLHATVSVDVTKHLCLLRCHVLCRFLLLLRQQQQYSKLNSPFRSAKLQQWHQHLHHSQTVIAAGVSCLLARAATAVVDFLS